MSSSYVEFYFSFFISRCLLLSIIYLELQCYAHSVLLVLRSTIIIIIIIASVIIINIIGERKAIPVAVTSINFL